MPTAIPALPRRPTVGLVGSMTGTQEVANPGLKRMRALQEAKAQLSLKAEVEKLTTQVAELESKLLSHGRARRGQRGGGRRRDGGGAADDQRADGEPRRAHRHRGRRDRRELRRHWRRRPPVDRAVPPPQGGRLAVCGLRSVDAFGKSKTPGWYHQYRHELYREKASRAAAAPDGCYISHSKYADEAVRIKDTGRLAFSAGK